MNIGDKLTYSYIKRIKGWMECPVCHKKMTYSKSKKSWICNDCAYTITEEDFLDDFVFWFCDECNAYLNVQEGFDKKSPKHICTTCGYMNDTTFDNIKGMCVDCGKVLANPDSSLCEDCRQIRREKAKQRMVKFGKAVEVAAIIADAVYLASQSPCKDNSSYDSIHNWDSDDEVMKKYPICKSCGAVMTDFDGWGWYTCPECGNMVRIIDGTVTWEDEIF